jgi:hypothetical protein
MNNEISYAQRATSGVQVLMFHCARNRYVSSDSPTAAGEAEWQAQQGQWQVHYAPTGVNITLRVAAATERDLLDG